MKPKLKIFSDFATMLLPLEVEYLLNAENFKDPLNREILLRIAEYKKTGNLALSQTVDKRKYSYLKKWIKKSLESIDVDLSLARLSDLDEKVMTDALLPEDEKMIVKMVQRQETLPFYFIRFYELVRDYHSFLLIRVRHQYVTIVEKYLSEHKYAYEKSKKISDRLIEATRDIIDHYSLRKQGSRKWEKWLKDLFYDEALDGLNRYYAIVRLTFLYYNYNELDKIVSIYDYLDTQIAKGKFYSRRILLNYYSNRVILHAKLDELEKAESFGYLSIQDKGSDYIHYLNNLCSVLLKRKKNKVALELMQRSIPELKKTISYHNRVGFAALLVKTLNANQKPAEAESYASTFFKAYKDQVMMHRWHTFFSAYLRSLIMQEKYREVLTICHRHKIMDHELGYLARASYLPAISWYYHLSLYKAGKTDLKSFKQYISSSEEKFKENAGILDLKEELSQHVSELFQRL